MSCGSSSGEKKFNNNRSRDGYDRRLNYSTKANHVSALKTDTSNITWTEHMYVSSTDSHTQPYTPTQRHTQLGQVGEVKEGENDVII